jgi:hypothetical protein
MNSIPSANVESQCPISRITRRVKSSEFHMDGKGVNQMGVYVISVQLVVGWPLLNLLIPSLYFDL